MGHGGSPFLSRKKHVVVVHVFENLADRSSFYVRPGADNNLRLSFILATKCVIPRQCIEYQVKYIILLQNAFPGDSMQCDYIFGIISL